VSNIQLKTGDVLLMLSKGEVSALIAWMGDSIYSHSAIVVDSGELIEAVGRGVVFSSLSELKKDKEGTWFVDAFQRIDHHGHDLSDSLRQAILRSAKTFLETPFEFGKLVQIGVISAVRQKWPQHWMARLLIREALDFVLANSSDAMTCSQFVYTSMLLAEANPANSAAPRIIVPAPTDLPFPDIDWLQFAIEARAIIAAAKPAAADGEIQWQQVSAQTISDDVLSAKAAVLRTQLGLTESISTHAHGRVINNPNPKLVTPQDLANSPDCKVLGRLVDFSSN
jgi:hypothetical protein